MGGVTNVTSSSAYHRRLARPNDRSGPTVNDELGGGLDCFEFHETAAGEEARIVTERSGIALKPIPNCFTVMPRKFRAVS